MRVGCVAAVCGLVGMAGCSVGSFNGLNSGQAAGTTFAGAKLTGTVHGGRQPIAGAHVYLFAANTSGYGQASKSMLTGTGSSDSLGGYVTTDSAGSFSITGAYTCVAGTQVYLYALGGDPGAGTNSAAGLLAALGNCPAAGNFLTSTPFIAMNEVSTVAAAYAFAGFATDATHVSSSGTALAQSGIANAFANAQNLAGIATGAALATTPSGNGTVPQSEINTLANVLASCVNTDGAVTGPTNATACYTLFTNALAGGTTGTQPTDTATAAIDIAHNPGANIASLYGLVSGTPPFGPALASQPNDFTIGLNFSGGGLNHPEAIAIDGSGNAWVPDANTSAVIELSNLGAVLSGTSGYTGGGIAFPRYIAIDSSGDAWIPNGAGKIVTELSSTGAVLSGTTGYSTGASSAPGPIAIDGSGNVWVEQGSSAIELSNSGSILSGTNGFSTQIGINSTLTFCIGIDGSGNVWTPNVGGSNVIELSGSGSMLSGASGYAGGGLQHPWAVALDSLGSAWVINSQQSGSTFTGTNTVSELSSTGSSLAGSFGFFLPGLRNPSSIAIDGAGNAWIADAGASSINYANSGITEVSSTGSVLSPSPNNYIGAGLDEPISIAIDSSGDVWAANFAGNSISEFVGAGTPVVTPLATGVKNNTLGTRP